MSDDDSMPQYVRELMNMIKSSNERMAAMEEKMAQLSQAARTADNGKAPKAVGNGNGIGDTSEANNARPNDIQNQTPITNPGTSNATNTDTNTYVTKEQLQQLLEQKNKTLSFTKFDLKLPYPARIAAKPYPKDYTSPKFK